MDRLDQSLDDLIKTNKTARKGNRGDKGKKTVAKSGGGFKKKSFNNSKPNFENRPQKQKLRMPTAADHVVTHSNVKVVAKKENNATSGILARIGTANGGATQGPSGTSVTFENLNFDITKDDVDELCSTIGETKGAKIIFDRSGRSTGSALVVFSKRSDAITAIKKFNGLTLDGAVMNVKLSTQNGKENPFNPSTSSGLIQPTGNTGVSKNVKAGLFGTAVDNDDDDDNNVRFKVNVNDRQGGHRQNNRNDRNGGRGRGRGAPRDNQHRGPKSSEELDDELGAYFATR